MSPSRHSSVPSRTRRRGRDAFSTSTVGTAIRLDGSECVLEGGPERDEVRVDRAVLVPERGLESLILSRNYSIGSGRFAANCCRSTGRNGGLTMSCGAHSCYIVPWLDGSLLIGATAEDVGFRRDSHAGWNCRSDGRGGRLLPGIGSRGSSRPGRSPAGHCRPPADHRPVAAGPAGHLCHRPLPERRPACAAYRTTREGTARGRRVRSDARADVCGQVTKTGPDPNSCASRTNWGQVPIRPHPSRTGSGTRYRPMSWAVSNAITAS